VAISGLSAAVIALSALLVVFVARPSLPGKLNASLFEDSAAQEAGIAWSGDAVYEPVPAAIRPAEFRQLLHRAGTSGSAGRPWVDELSGGPMDGSRVKALEDERIYAVRRYELTSGRRVLVYTQLCGEPSEPSLTGLTAIRDF